MDEVDAEAAVILLGQSLTWVDETSPGIEGMDLGLQEWVVARHETETGCQCYMVSGAPGEMAEAMVSVTYWTPQGVVDEERTKRAVGDVVPLLCYPSVTRAKAACVIHAATGVFPPATPLRLRGKGDADADAVVGEWYGGAPDPTGRKWWMYTEVTSYHIYESVRRRESGASSFRASCVCEPLPLAPVFPSLDQAKAACERHHATGQWN